MPAKADKTVKARGGVAKYRSMKKGDKLFTCAVTRKNGPRGGKSVCWKRHESLSAAEVAGELLEDSLIEIAATESFQF